LKSKEWPVALNKLDGFPVSKSSISSKSIEHDIDKINENEVMIPKATV
jgi:hypothetical protein